MFPRPWLAAGVWLTLAAASFTPVHAQAAPADRGGRETVRLLDIPYVPQSEALCGGAALAMVFRYWGGPSLLAEDFASLLEPGAAGIRTDTLVAAVRAKGWTALPVTGTPTDLREHLGRGRPVIALLGVGSGALHYVVLAAWANGGVIYHDPAVAPFRVSGAREFDEAWARSGRWALLVLPPPSAVELADHDSAGLDSTLRGAIATDSSASALPDMPARVLHACESMVGEAVSHARAGDKAEAERLLRAAEVLCPESAAPVRERAGLRFLSGDWTSAAGLAERALRLDPGDRATWRLLAGSRFLLGDEVGALRAWNRISEPRADLARVDGLSRIRYRAVARQLSLPPGSLLTSRAFVRARRRLAAMPAPSMTRLSLKPLPQGAAQVNAALLERPLLFDGPLDAGGT
ncbi:MAG TPA: C39 family peptidase, partial [Acidobacteriota bacterium]|nr:C39 family peptidase [Acidobacteriota bacterium]